MMTDLILTHGTVSLEKLYMTGSTSCLILPKLKEVKIGNRSVYLTHHIHSTDTGSAPAQEVKVVNRPAYIFELIRILR